MPNPDAAPKKGAGGEHNGLGPVHTSEVGPHALDPLLLSFSFHLEAGHHRFAERQVGRVLQQLQHLAGVQPFIGLCA